jgi:hypothetical protein
LTQGSFDSLAPLVPQRVVVSQRAQRPSRQRRHSIRLSHPQTVHFIALASIPRPLAR